MKLPPINVYCIYICHERLLFGPRKIVDFGFGPKVTKYSQLPWGVRNGSVHPRGQRNGIDFTRKQSSEEARLGYKLVLNLENKHIAFSLQIFSRLNIIDLFFSIFFRMNFNQSR